MWRHVTIGMHSLVKPGKYGLLSRFQTMHTPHPSRCVPIHAVSRIGIDTRISKEKPLVVTCHPRSFILPCFIPKGEFDAIAYSHFVVNHGKVVPDYVHLDPKFDCNFSILQTVCDEARYSKLPIAENSRAIQQWLSNRHVTTPDEAAPLCIRTEQKTR
jgi:hypothetical protein